MNCWNEVASLLRSPGEVLAFELRPGFNYEVKGHWHGDFVGTLMDNSSWNWKIFRVVETRASSVSPGEEVEVAVNHAKFYYARGGPLEVRA